ncbi:fimbria/pilus outer membrane usher protein [Yersinia sp. 2541 StPb PI]|uniref:fimbria/pilus outer membrane usher protein n=1 Tax=Yersinia sp. 2541 StPb PI TaxID=3117407 RepID=UPI003FA47CDF
MKNGLGKDPIKKIKHNIHLTRLSYFILCQLGLLMTDISSVRAEDYFNPALLELDNPSQAGADLSVFERNNAQAPGVYRVDVLLNNEFIDTRELEFALVNDTTAKESLQPCLTIDELAQLGVKVSAFPGLANEGCVDLSTAIPQASTEFRFDQQQLNLSIPQAALTRQVRGYVSPTQWDQGITALLANYSFSGSNSRVSHEGSNNNSYFLNLRSGVNVGPWRLRNYSTWNRDTAGTNEWNSINTYLQRNIIALRSQLTLGDSSSPSDVFDSVPFRGGQLTSDEEMLPDSMKGYSPVVRGIAKSNAQITVRQNGFVIYQSYVSPGAFEINDLYSTSGSGDLAVTVTEADGSEQNFVVPFASVPVLQREGALKYSLTGGNYRSSDRSVDKTTFAQGTAIYGLPWGLTVYGGIQGAENYQAVSGGFGKNMGRIGAISLDITEAQATFSDESNSSGQSWRFRYGKSFVETGTNFSLAGYRYSTQGFYTLQETLDTFNSNNNQPNQQHKRSRAEVVVSQNLGQSAGSLSVSLIDEGYWDNGQKTQSMSVGYSNSWQGISYGINYNRNKNAASSNGTRSETTDQVVALNVSIPLDRWMSNSWANYSMSSTKGGRTTHNVGVSGTSLENNNLSWGVNQGYTTQGDGSNGNVTASYDGSSGQINGGYSYDKSQNRINYGVQGGVVFHSGGVTLSQSLGETVVLVKAPGAEGVAVNNNRGIRTDARGYAVVPYTSPYRSNPVSLDTGSLPDDVELELTSQTVIPTRGAVVVANYQTKIGQRVMMTLQRSNGQPVPFGATVSDASTTSENGFIVGDEGQVYLTGMANSGKLLVQWGKNSDSQCVVDYQLPKHRTQDTTSNGILMMRSRCQ